MTVEAPSETLRAVEIRFGLAREIFSGRSSLGFLGPDQINRVYPNGLGFGPFFTADDVVPPVRFTEDQLRRGSEHGLTLALVPSRVSMSGFQATKSSMRARGWRMFNQQENYGWCSSLAFFEEATEHARWVMLGLEPLAPSLGKNPIGQTRCVAEFLAEFFDELPMPQLVERAINDFDDGSEKEMIDCAEDNPGGVSALLTQLELTRRFKPRPVELFWAAALYQGLAGSSPLACRYACTSRRTHDDCELIRMGGFAAKGGGTLDTMASNAKCENTGVCVMIPPLH